ncbi:class III lanthionine synthetase LanKC N-terminal domain-containing protein [Schleiferilactobacillus harbinensis]|uniref:class III lanthionine synthetase LanKC N-terminal domain-containing protein n=1 Tax=Schleiferilactobacillus harbinensis TaxID=304207 RepID=UPI000481CED1|nr:lanthionine synthetase LanC family protein [Schleiferilactobacillus harbinensis]
MESIDTIIEKNAWIADQLTTDVEYDQSAYKVHADGVWRFFLHNNGSLPAEGWKGHISIGIDHLRKVLGLVIPIFEAYKCSFKIPYNWKIVSALLNSRANPESANKIITFYPANDAIFRRLIVELCNSLKGYEAPTICSDFQCGFHSPVHFRYGAFQKMIEYSENKHRLVYLRHDHTGQLVEDSRAPFFSTPEDVEFPFSDDECKQNGFNMPPINANNEVNKYCFQNVLHRANRGNTYLAVMRDRHSTVVLKQAKPYIYEAQSLSSIDSLRHEYSMMCRFSKSGYTALPIEQFQCNGDWFISEHFLSGYSLAEYVAENGPLPLKRAAELASQMVKMVRYFHSEGVVICDLSPNNVIIVREGIKLIDLEYMQDIQSDAVRSGGTPGFWDLSHEGKILGNSDDRFALAAIYFFMRTQTVLGMERLSGTSELLEKTHILISSGVLNLSDEKIIKSLLGTVPVEKDSSCIDENLSRKVRLRFVQIQKEMLNSKDSHFWSKTPFGEYVDWRSHQHGLAGLLTAMHEINVNSNTKQLLLNKITKSLFPIARFRDASMLFGAAGVLKALTDIAYDGVNRPLEQLEIDNLFDQIRYAETGKKWDYATGEIGLIKAVAHLERHNHQTRYLTFLRQRMDRLYFNANEIIRQCCQHTNNLTYFGYAHGLTGLGNVFCSVGRFLGNNEFVRKGDEIFEIVINATSFYLDTNPVSVMGLSWCEGVAGIGSGIIRAYSQTLNGTPMNSEVYEFIEKLIRYLHSNFHIQSLPLCHGMAGTLSFLNDCQEFLSSYTTMKAARDVAEYMVATVGEKFRFTDETMMTHAMDYGVGQLGCLTQLYRYDRIMHASAGNETQPTRQGRTI